MPSSDYWTADTIERVRPPPPWPYCPDVLQQPSHVSPAHTRWCSGFEVPPPARSVHATRWTWRSTSRQSSEPGQSARRAENGQDSVRAHSTCLKQGYLCSQLPGRGLGLARRHKLPPRHQHRIPAQRRRAAAAAALRPVLLLLLLPHPASPVPQHQLALPMSPGTRSQDTSSYKKN